MICVLHGFANAHQGSPLCWVQCLLLDQSAIKSLQIDLAAGQNPTCGLEGMSRGTSHRTTDHFFILDVCAIQQCCFASWQPT